MTALRIQPASARLSPALLLAVLACVTTGQAAQPPWQPGEALDSAETESYNVCFTLQAAAPLPKDASAALIFARQGNSFYTLRFSSRETTLFRCTDANSRRLATGRPAWRGPGAVEVVIKRRATRLCVEAQREVLLEAWDGSYHEGEVSLAAGARGFQVTGLLVQPVDRVAFADDFFAEPSRGALWQPANGSWQIGIYRDKLTARQGGPPGASWYAGQGGNALSLTGYDFWEDYGLEVSALARADTWMGLAFFAADDGFTAFAVLPEANQGRAELFRVRQGQRTVLAQARVSCPPGLWHRLRVEATPADIRAFLNQQPVLTAPTTGAASGRVGLFASGPGEVHFDDFAADGLDSFDDFFAQPAAGRWEFARGRWQAGGGKLVGSGSSDALAVIAHRTWRDASVSVTLKPGAAPAGLIWRAQDEGSYYALLASGDTWRLVKELAGVETSLADGRLPSGGGRVGDSVRLGVLCRGPQMVVQADGRELGRAYDFGLQQGRAGLLVRGQGKATFSGLQVRAEAADLAATISLLRFENEVVPGPDAGESVPVLGYLWRPTAGLWGHHHLDDGSGALRAVARGGQRAVLSHRQVAPGSVLLSAQLPAIPEGTVGLGLCTDGRDIDTGYALAFSAGQQPSLKLLRRGQVVAEQAALAGDDLSWPTTMTLFRDGNVVGAAGGDSGLTYTDPDPLPDGHPALWVSGGQALFDDLRLGNLRATVDRFDGPAPDWVPSHGRWVVHSGMACIAWDYWTTAFGEPLALTWQRQPCAADFVLDCNVSEYSEGYASGEHKHFPYHDICVAFCGDGREPDSGYRFLIASEGGKVTKLLRKGAVVAQTAEPRFRIVSDDEYNTPRAFDAQVQRKGGRISLALNGLPALQYEDPEPLAPGQVGLGLAECAADFRDVILYTWP